MKHKTLTRRATMIGVTVAAAGIIPAQAAEVQLNGQTLHTSVAPMTTHGRILVPMRDIFEALGAKVDWNALTQGINAQRGTTQVQMQMGKSVATVNGQTVNLDQAPMAVNGSTMVPLRFVSEAMGAKVDWNNTLQVVSIQSSGTGAVATNPGSTGTQTAGVRDIRIPSGVVVPVTLDQALSSATSRVGDPFTATVKSVRAGDSEFPAGSKVEGVVVEATPKNGSEPGVLALDFRSVTLPDGSRYSFSGDLVSLDNKSVSTNANGRLVAKNTSKSNKLKVIGIGAGAGYVIGKVLLKKNGGLSAVLGALGGYLYDAQKNKNRSAEASVPAGTAIGVRLNEAVSYHDTTGYYPQRLDMMRTNTR
jgi:hypothetical protein